MLENQFKTNLVRELKERFPGCIVLHIDPNEIQGIPDLLILYRDRWAALEGKRSLNAPHRPNQDYYSDNCFGTADAICFRDDILRIHDLKTGAIPAHMEQLLIYDALFCLEYRIKPEKIQIENRIYQSDDILIANPCPDDINPIMDKIREFDPIIAKLRMGVC